MDISRFICSARCILLKKWLRGPGTSLRKRKERKRQSGTEKVIFHTVTVTPLRNVGLRSSQLVGFCFTLAVVGTCVVLWIYFVKIYI